jgi:hypothetical protein
MLRKIGVCMGIALALIVAIVLYPVVGIILLGAGEAEMPGSVKKAELGGAFALIGVLITFLITLAFGYSEIAYVLCLMYVLAFIGLILYLVAGSFRCFQKPISACSF